MRFSKTKSEENDMKTVELNQPDMYENSNPKCVCGFIF